MEAVPAPADVPTGAEAWPAAGRPFTVAELDRMPDDGRRYELLSGALVVEIRSPSTALIDLAGLAKVLIPAS